MWLLKISDPPPPQIFFSLELSCGVIKGVGLALMAEEKWKEKKNKKEKEKGTGLGLVWGKVPINILKE